MIGDKILGNGLGGCEEVGEFISGADNCGLLVRCLGRRNIRERTSCAFIFCF